MDKQKDFLTNLRLYMTIVIVIVVSIGSGVSKLYNADVINFMFYIGAISIFCLLIVFVLLAKKLHKETDKLEEMN